MAAGLAAFLIGLAPRSGIAQVHWIRWAIAGAAAVAVTLTLVVLSRVGGATGACLLGAAAGLGFGMTAALMKSATAYLPQGLGAVFASWQLWVMVVAGVLSLFLLQNALQSGTLVAAQPAVTFTDPATGVLLGVLLFHEQVRLGVWLVLEVFGVIAIVAGSVELARSPLVAGDDDPDRP